MREAEKPPVASYAAETIIAVIGGSAPSDDEVLLAEAVGRGLAEHGAVLICGGRRGVMEGACRGARSAGGLTIGILPGCDLSDANPYIDIPILTGIGPARNAIITRTAHAVIAIGGSYGTLSEIGFALTFGVPVIGLRTWQVSREGHPLPPILVADTPEEAVEAALAAAKRKE